MCSPSCSIVITSFFKNVRLPIIFLIWREFTVEIGAFKSEYETTLLTGLFTQGFRAMVFEEQRKTQFFTGNSYIWVYRLLISNLR